MFFWKSHFYLSMRGIGDRGVFVEDNVDVALGDSASDLGKGSPYFIINIIPDSRSDLKSPDG